MHPLEQHECNKDVWQVYPLRQHEWNILTDIQPAVRWNNTNATSSTDTWPAKTRVESVASNNWTRISARSYELRFRVNKSSEGKQRRLEGEKRLSAPTVHGARSEKQRSEQFKILRCTGKKQIIAPTIWEQTTPIGISAG